jgi:hypothetical protein
VIPQTISVAAASRPQKPREGPQARQRPPAKPEACRRWSGSKPLGPSERSLSIRSRWVLRDFGAGLSSTIGGRNGTGFTPGDAPLPGASRCSPLLIPASAPISGPGVLPELSNSGSLPGKAHARQPKARIFVRVTRRSFCDLCVALRTDDGRGGTPATARGRVGRRSPLTNRQRKRLSSKRLKIPWQLELQGL